MKALRRRGAPKVCRRLARPYRSPRRQAAIPAQRAARRRHLPPASVPHEPTPAGSAPPAVPAWRRWLRSLLPVAVVVLALQTVRGQIPGIDQIRPVVADGELAWIGAALLAEIVSMSLFARQQTNLLKGVGVHAGLGGALALAYTRSALSISMPAGTAVSAGYAYQRFRRWGASPEAATAVMIMSGVFSFVSLALLYVAGFLLTFLAAPVSTWRGQPILTPAVLAVSAGTAALLVRHRLRARASLTIDGPVDEEDLDFLAGSPDAAAAHVPGRSTRSGFVRTRLRRLAQLLRDVAAVAESMPRRHRTTALGLSALNWLADLACLAAVAQAFHLPLDLLQLGTVYVAAQLVRQIPITPGGIGVIEATLLAALTAAGAEPAAAAATVLGYRLLSCWLVIPAGLTTWAFMRRADRRTSAGPAAAPAQRASEAPVPATADPALATPSGTAAAAARTPETARG
ncbi:lysylphosphatidylglycerol synthase transmembrane domain-containing protein [Catellatospora coxensis]|uniref:lysylphosphatidylglycerol synthase transmembrane domain-containing protein n=1 Tax=Catellatospora coxensis TaxID=310354 RepID=UPI00194422E8|nr:lysylphosphatidylglycerol synthase transmembrane domain-containing protein [Catellatospora coxensis]